MAPDPCCRMYGATAWVSTAGQRLKRVLNARGRSTVYRPDSAGWPGLNLLEPAEPVLHVMGADDPAVHDLVEVVRPYLGLATGRRDAEELAGVDAAHLGAHADHSVSLFAASVDDLFDDGAEVAEGLEGRPCRSGRHGTGRRAWPLRRRR